MVDSREKLGGNKMTFSHFDAGVHVHEMSLSSYYSKVLQVLHFSRFFMFFMIQGSSSTLSSITNVTSKIVIMRPVVASEI